MIRLRPRRRGEREAVEWLDTGEASRREILESYRELELVNRWLGGHRATFDAMERSGALPPGPSGRGAPLRVLDVAGGAGGFARRFLEWGRARGLPVRVTLVDLEPLALASVRGNRGVRPIRADALALPFADRAVEIAHCSTFLHHLSVLHARDLLAEMCRVSRSLVVVNDLVRSWVAYAGIWTLTRALGGGRLVRHDGPLSVLKAFAPEELRAIAGSVFESEEFRWTLERTFPYRMCLLGARVGDPAPG
ncbi:MAG: methyltransferase domain-containing protein [Gemmatimonadota bacterium]|nr:methyltransferase domain-containing protein [Gemmatimonadota bacterium]